MVRDLQNIEQELQEVENQAETLSEQLKTAYQEYTDILGDTLKQQLVFSVYQICTQEYPDGFLNLSLSQQQNLQKNVRELAEQAKENLKLGGEFLKQMEVPTEDSQQDNDHSEQESDTLFSEQWETVSDVEGQTEEQTNDAKINQDILKELLASTQQDSESESADTSSNHPDQVLNWSKLQENAIAQILENVSSQTNETLKESGILPQEFPKEMIDAALQAEGAGSMSNRAPGVLHLMLEVERKNQQQKSENNEVMQLTIIRLGVGEMEFAAPSLNMKRRELRNIAQQVQQLQQQYHKLIKERAIAQAELAWRSSWHEDEA